MILMSRKFTNNFLRALSANQQEHEPPSQERQGPLDRRAVRLGVQAIAGSSEAQQTYGRHLQVYYQHHIWEREAVEEVLALEVPDKDPRSSGLRPAGEVGGKA